MKKTSSLSFVCALFVCVSGFAGKVQLTCGDKTVILNETTLRMKIIYPKGRETESEEGFANKTVKMENGVRSEVYFIHSPYSLTKESKQSASYKLVSPRLNSPPETLTCDEGDIL